MAAVALVTLVIGVGLVVHRVLNRRGDASTPAAAINRALYDINHYHLADLCNDFTKEAVAADVAPELFNVSDCTDSRLAAVQRRCWACRKGDRAVSISPPRYTGQHATVTLVVADDEHATMREQKLIHLVKVGDEWKLEDNPEATR